MARRVIAYNWGWRLSRASKLDEVDATRLARELDVRGITCEMPFCTDTAFSVLPSGVTALICFNHSLAYETSAKVAAAIEAAIKFNWQSQMAVITNAAFEDSDDDVVTTFSKDDDLLAKARAAANGVELLMKMESRKLAAVGAMPTTVIGDSDAGDIGVRPTLNHLGPQNTSDQFFDPFVI